MTTIVEPDSTQVEVLQTALGSGVYVVSSVDRLDAALESRLDEYAVVFGPSLALDQATEIASHYRIARPALGFILIRNRIDAPVLAAALQAGMRQVVELRDMRGLTEAVSAAHQVYYAMRRNSDPGESPKRALRGRVVTVFSTKGGVGKSTVSTNLGAALAARGQSTCIVDLDVAGGDVALMLQLFPEHTLSDLKELRGAIDEVGARSLVTPHSEQLSVIAAPLGVDGREQVSPQEVGQLLSVLRREFAWVIADTSGSFDEFALAAIDHTDTLMMVGSLDIPSLKNLKLAAGTLDLLNIPRAHWRLVLNRADPRVGLSKDEFTKTLGIEVTAAIPSSVEVLASVNRGVPIVLGSPRHEASRTFDTLAKDLMSSYDMGKPSKTSESQAGKRRLLRRR
jgi:pilus assembly protein CpaE